MLEFVPVEFPPSLGGVSLAFSSPCTMEFESSSSTEEVNSDSLEGLGKCRPLKVARFELSSLLTFIDEDIALPFPLSRFIESGKSAEDEEGRAELVEGLVDEGVWSA